MKFKKFPLLIYSYLGFDWEGLLVQKVVAPHVPDIKVRFIHNIRFIFPCIEAKIIMNFRHSEVYERGSRKNFRFFQKTLEGETKKNLDS